MPVIAELVDPLLQLYVYGGTPSLTRAVIVPSGVLGQEEGMVFKDTIGKNPTIIARTVLLFDISRSSTARSTLTVALKLCMPTIEELHLLGICKVTISP